MEIRVVEANDERCSPTPHALSTTPTPPRSVPNLCAHPCSPTVTVRSRRVTHSAHLHIHTVDDADSSMTRLAWSTEMGRRSIIASAAPPPPAVRTSPPPHPHCIPIHDRYMGRETARTRTPQELSLRAQRGKTSQSGSIIVTAATSRPQSLLLSQRAPPRPDSRGRRLLNQATRRGQRGEDERIETPRRTRSDQPRAPSPPAKTMAEKKVGAQAARDADPSMAQSEARGEGKTNERRTRVATLSPLAARHRRRR
jgi:hypothetical protein